MTINYDGRVFRGETDRENGEVGGRTVFFYRRQGQRLEATYRGGAVVYGHLLGSVNIELHDDRADPLAQALLTQYSAALATLEEAIDRFPEPSWRQDHPDDTADRVVFHTLFFTDYYLSPGPDAFRKQPYHAENPGLFRNYEELGSPGASR